MKKKILSIFLVLSMCLGVLVGCESKKGDSKNDGELKKVEIKNEGDPIKLATMGDEEGKILGSMMVQVLEANGYEVENLVGTFHNTTIIRESLLQKQVDLTMDYTGRGLMFIENVDEVKFHELDTAFEACKEEDAKNDIEWLCYAPFNNTDGIAVKKEWAEKNKIETMKDFGEYVSKGGEMKVAIADAYVVQAPTCLPGWEKEYGFKLKENQIIIGATEPKKMVADNVDGVLACHTYTTSGLIESLGLKVIEDTNMVSPVYSPAPLASKEIMEKYPEIKDIVKPIFDSLDEEKMISLNSKLEKEGVSESDIAKEYLVKIGLLK